MGLSRRPGGPLPWRLALETLTLTVCLGVCVQPASAQGAAAGVINATVGDTVTLTAPAVTVTILTSSWYRGIGVAASQIICTYFASPPRQVNGLQYTGRETCQSDGSLQIRDLLTNYTRNYTVNVQPNGESAVEATRQLMVYEPVTKPTVTWVPSQLVENRGPAEITCNTSSAAVTILWYFNSTSALPGNIIQSPNRTLTITNVSRGDSGIYQCEALNPISRKMSDPQTLTVAYGPEDVKIDPSGSQVLQVGDKLSLSCTAGSFPAPKYQWLLNGADLNRPGNTYTVEKVSSRDDGNYTCMAENTVTGLIAKASVSITVNGTDPTPAPDNSEGLPVGAIVGIVIGVLAVVIIVCVLVYIFVIKKPASGGPAAGDSTEMAPNNKEGSASPKANGTAAEIQYSSVNFVPKRGTPAKPVSPENTVYSEVRR